MALFIEKNYRTAAAVFTVLLSTTAAGQANAQATLAYQAGYFPDGATWGADILESTGGRLTGVEGVGQKTSAAMNVFNAAGTQISTGVVYTISSAMGADTGEAVNISTYTLNVTDNIPVLPLPVGAVTGTTGTLKVYTSSSSAFSNATIASVALSGAGNMSIYTSNGTGDLTLGVTNGISTLGNLTLKSDNGGGAVDVTAKNITVTGPVTISTAGTGEGAILKLTEGSSTASSGVILDGAGNSSTLDLSSIEGTFTGTIDGAVDGNGQLKISGVSTIVASAVGSGHRLNNTALTLATGETTTFNSTLASNTINVTGAGNVIFKNSVTSSSGITLTGDANLRFQGAGSTISADIATAVTGEGSLYVDESTSILGDVGSNTQKLQDATVVASKTLAVTGDVYLSSKLDMGASSTVTIGGNAVIGDGTGSTNAIVGGAGSVLNLNGDATIAGLVATAGDIVTDASGTRTFNYGVAVDDFTANGGTTTFNGTVTTTGNVNLYGTADFNGGNLVNVGGSFVSNVGSDVDVSGNLIVAQTASFNGATDVTGTVQANTIDTAGTTNLNGAVTSAGDVTLTGTSHFGSNLTSTTGDIDATGIVTVDGKIAATAGTLTYSGINTMQVTGTTDVNALVLNNGASTFTGKVTAANVTLSGSNNSFGDVSVSGITTINSGSNDFNGTLNSTTLTVNAGTNTFDGAVGGFTTATLNGTNTFGSTVNGTTLNASGTSTYNGTVNVTNFNVNNAGTVNLNANGNGTLTFNTDGNVHVASGYNWAGTITSAVDGIGNLYLHGNRTISNVVTANTIKSLNIADAGSVVTLTSAVDAENLRIMGTGTANINATQTSDLMFDANGTVNVADNVNLTQTIDTTIANAGTVNFLGDTTVTGQVGATNAVGNLNIGIGTVTFASNVNSKNLTFTQDGVAALGDDVVINTANIDGSADNVGTLATVADATINSVIGATHAIKNIDIASGGVQFNADIKSQSMSLANGAVATFTNGVDVTAAVDGDTAGLGTLVFSGTSTVNGAIGANVRVGQITTGTGIVTLNGTVNVTTLQAGTGTTYLNDDGEGTLRFAGNGTVVVAANQIWDGDVTTTVKGNGNLNLIGDRLITTQIASTKINTIGLGTAGSSSILSSNVNANYINILGTGLVTASVNLSSNTTFTANGTLAIADNYNLTGNVTANVASLGTLKISGTSTISGGVGTVAVALGDVQAGYDGEVATFNSAIYADETHVAGKGRINLNLGGVGAVLFDEDGTVALADDQVWSGAVNSTTPGEGNLIFSGDASGITSIGNTGHLKTMTLAGNDTSVSVSGAVIAANTLNLGNSDLLGGSFTIDGTKTINTTINSNTLYGKIITTGDADVASTSNLNVSVNTSEYLADGKTFEIVKGGVTSDVQNIDAHLATKNIMLDFTQVDAGDALGIQMNYRDVSEVTSNADLIEAGDVFYSIQHNVNPYMEQLNLALLNATTMAEVEDVLGDFLPEVGDGEKNSVIDNNAQIQYLAEQRIEDLRLGDYGDYGFSASTTSGMVDDFGYEQEDYGFGSTAGEFSGISSGSAKASNSSMWIQGYYNNIKQDTVDAIVGYSADGYGLSIGFDNANWIDNGILGVSLNLGTLEVTSDDSVNTADSEIFNYGINVYTNYEFGNNIFVNSQFGFSLSDTDKERGNAGGPAFTAKSNYGSTQISSKLAVGADFFPVNGLTITPVASLSNTMIDTESYTETGAATGLNMTVGSHKESLMRAGFKVESNLKLMDTQGTVLKPGVKLGYFYDISNDPVQATATYESSTVPFTTGGTTTPKSSYMIGTSMDYLSEANWEMATDFDYVFKDGYRSFTGIARFTNYF